MSTFEPKPITLSSTSIRVRILPDLGGKIGSIRSLPSARDLLLQPERPYRVPAYADPFVAYDTSGFDECLPTIGECLYPDGAFAGVRLPDHGEVWSTSWAYEQQGEELVLSTRGRALPYRFTKRLQVTGTTLNIRYELENLSERPFAYLWSAHPLLAVEPGARLLLPPEVSEVLVQWSRHDRLGRLGDRCAWPEVVQADGTVRDLSRLGDGTGKTAEKLFTDVLQRGIAALYWPRHDESLVFRFDVEDTPYLGVWICEGGWPEDHPAGHFTVALEPCNGRPDALADAMTRDECPRVEGRSRHTWSLRLEVVRGRPEIF